MTFFSFSSFLSISESFAEKKHNTSKDPQLSIDFYFGSESAAGTRNRAIDTAHIDVFDQYSHETDKYQFHGGKSNLNSHETQLQTIVW